MESNVFDENEITDGGIVELSPELDKMITAKITQADKEIDEMRMQIRWSKKQIDVVKKASAIMGIPYQTYVKLVVYKRAMDDLDQNLRISL